LGSRSEKGGMSDGDDYADMFFVFSVILTQLRIRQTEGSDVESV
jgi:hypothetical protein